MKVTVAVDSFKGSLSSMEAGNSVKSGILRVVPDARTAVKPLADGGEGTVEALVSGMGGVMHQITVTGPLGEPVNCTYGVLGSGTYEESERVTYGEPERAAYEKPERAACRVPEHTAIMEMAGAAGITLVPQEKEIPSIPPPMA